MATDLGEYIQHLYDHHVRITIDHLANSYLATDCPNQKAEINQVAIDFLTNVIKTDNEAYIKLFQEKIKGMR